MKLLGKEEKSPRGAICFQQLGRLNPLTLEDPCLPAGQDAFRFQADVWYFRSQALQWLWGTTFTEICPSFPLEMHSSWTVGDSGQSPCLQGGCTLALCLGGLLSALPTSDTTWQPSHVTEKWKMASPKFAAFPLSANDHCPNIFPRLFKCVRKSHRFSPDMALTNYKAWNKVKKFNSFTANCHEQTPDQTHFSSSCIKNTIEVLITL